MRINKSLLAALAATLTLGSCTDFANGFDETAHYYQENFVKEFGQIDPNQDWNAAGQFVAEANMAKNISGTLTIYTAAPTTYGSQILARTPIENGVATIKFDAVKNTKSLYARVEKDGHVLSSGIYDVVDGVLRIGNNLGTRADATCPVTYEDFGQLVNHLRFEIVQQFINSNEETYTAYDNRTDDTYKVKNVDSDGNPIVGGGPTYFSGNKYGDFGWASLIKEQVPKLHLLKGVDFSNHDDGFTEEELDPIFDKYTNKFGKVKDGVFKEGIDHIEQYVQTGEMTPNVTLTVKENGPVELDLMWRGTEFEDYFGYYYYNEEDLSSVDWWNEVDKYILINKVESEGQDNTVGNNWIKNTSSLTQSWDAKNEVWKNENGMFTSNFDSWQGGNKVRGTKLKLVNFASGSASYNFNKGTKIGFFFVTLKDGGGVDRFFVSDTKIDYELFQHRYKNQDLGRGGRPYAAKFAYDGRTYVGFGDESGDCDLNDIVFIADNVEQPTGGHDITPLDLPEPLDASWMVACEDLGASDDIDFNDVVFKITHVAGTETANIYPLAAGGWLASDIMYNGSSLGEVHQLLGAAPAKSGEYSPINAESFTVKPRPITINVDEDFSIASYVVGKNIATSTGSLAGLSIKTDGESSGFAVASKSFVFGDQEIGNVPQAIVLPSTYRRPASEAGMIEIGDWPWPKERVGIATAFNVEGHKFSDWVGNADDVDWYNYFDDSKVVLGSSAVVSGSVDGGDIDPENPSGPTTTKTDWDIKVTGSSTISKNEQVTYIVSVVGQDNINGLTYAVDESGVISTVSTGYGSVTVKGLKAGTGTLYVTFPEDETHRSTTKAFEITVEEMSFGTEISYTQTNDDGNGNITVSVDKTSLSQIIPNGAVTITAVGNVTNSGWYHFSQINAYVYRSDWNTDAWTMFGQEGQSGPDYVSWKLTADEYSQLLNSNESYIKMTWTNISVEKLYIAPTSSYSKKRKSR